MSLFQTYIYRYADGDDNKRIIINDTDGLFLDNKCESLFISEGYKVILYTSDLDFRIDYECDFKTDNKKWLIVISNNEYIPYDIFSRCSVYEIAYHTIFKKLNRNVLINYPALDLNLLTNNYVRYYGDDILDRDATKDYIQNVVYGHKNVASYLPVLYGEIKEIADKANNYHDWIHVAEKMAEADLLAIENSLPISCPICQEKFKNYILNNFGKLSTKWDNKNAPLLVSQAMEYMSSSDKFIIIVMDGMSEIDWLVIEKYFNGIKYSKGSSFAMIPTVTSISRQCLLAGKLPIQLEDPWHQSNEKKEFLHCAEELGYNDNKTQYERGYEAVFKNLVKCGAVIINEIDDTVHGQQQGRIGMYNAVLHIAKEGKLLNLVKRLLQQGFDVYITADHGNTCCTGVGGKRSGVETVTKSNRMRVLKDYADINELSDKYELISYPGYYLDKKYKYMICDKGKSFDSYGSKVMTHGGVTLEEVIVPFITIKAEENRG